MIKKNYELDKIDFKKNNILLFYGINEGLKNEHIKNIVKKTSYTRVNYFEAEIFDDLNVFFESIITKSFFENKKILIIKKSTEKIKSVIETIIEKKLEDIIVIIDSDELTKKSKLRVFFEKDEELICSAFYPDDYQSLSKITEKFFVQKNISVSRDIINLIVERANGSRMHLNYELNKIENFALNEKKIDYSDIQKLTNLGSNYNISELVDQCLAKNKNKFIKIINENNFSNDETIIIIRTFLTKTKRLYLIRKEIDKKKIDLEKAISNFKPPIFWKDKNLVKTQITLWSKESIQNLLVEITDTELLIKKNINNSINILLNFMHSQSSSVSN